MPELQSLCRPAEASCSASCTSSTKLSRKCMLYESSKFATALPFTAQPRVITK